MGACFSSEAGLQERQPQPDSKICSTTASTVSAGSNVNSSKLSMMQSTAQMRASPVIQQVRTVLELLSDIPVAGYSSDCDQACEVLQQALEQCDAVSLHTYKCSSPSVCVLAGTAGVGVQILQQQLVTSGSSWAAPLCCMQLGTQYLFRSVTSADDVRRLPQDWAALHQQAGLSTFLAMHITVAGQETPIGVLTLASKTPGAFMDNSLALQLDMISTGIVPLLTSPWLTALTTLASQLREPHCMLDNSFTAFAASFLEGSAQLLQSTTHMALGVRLGLLSADEQEVMLLHRSSGDSASSLSGSFIRQSSDHSNGPSCSSSIDCDVATLGEFTLVDHNSMRKVHVTPQQLHMEVARLPAEQTLLSQAVKSKKPQFVADISVYLAQDEEDKEFPCADLVDLGDEHLASIVVLPLSGAENKAVGALYVTYQRTGDFLQGNAVVDELALVLQKLLKDQMTKVPELWEEFQVSPISSESCTLALVGPSTPTASVPSATLSRSKSNTRLAVLHPVWQREDQHQIVCGSDSYIKELEIHSILGQGGFSTVYAGSWHGSRTAIKVMPAATTDKMGINMKAAMEMAALSTLRHPNIVRTYACLTEMVEERKPRQRHVSADNLSPKVADLQFRRATSDDYAAGKPVYNILVMERCDRGCLWNAVRHQNLLHKKLPDGRSRINMRLLYYVLHDVATSLKYLHSMEMIHCDLKAENIIMESSSVRTHGFTCKLADFGLVKLLGDDGFVPNTDTSGTLTHFAPERFKTGGMIGEAVDVFSFGVMMYELYAGQKPYQGIQPGPALAKGILHGLRPQFPSSTPVPYRQLAEECWAADPAQRPSTDAVVSRLQELMEAPCRSGAK